VHTEMIDQAELRDLVLEAGTNGRSRHIDSRLSVATIRIDKVGSEAQAASIGLCLLQMSGN